MTSIKIAAIIPARMASTCHPGKPLIEIQDLPMIEHVRRRALLCGFSEVVVATCDTEIVEVVETLEENNYDLQGAHHGQVTALRKQSAI